MSLSLDHQCGKESIRSCCQVPCDDGTGVYVHIVAPAVGDKMEDLRELQWIWAVVDLR